MTVLAIDVGGTTLKGAVLDVAGRVRRRSEVPTPSGGDAVVEALQSLAVDLTDAEVLAGGVVVPGEVDVDAGIAAYAANLGWRDVPLRDLLQTALGVPVAIEHDMRAAGLAEQITGATSGAADVLFVGLGTGISAAVIVDGRIVRGAAGLAGEFGHAPVFPDGEPCYCGARGCTEVYASAAGIARRYAAAAGTPLPAEGVIARVGTDVVAKQIWHDATEALSLALTTATLTVDPGVIVLGGGLARAGETLLHPVRGALAARLPWRRPPAVEISTLGSEAGLLGAAILAWRAAGRDAGAGWR